MYAYMNTSGSRGWAHAARAPPNGRGPIIFYAPNAKLSLKSNPGSATDEAVHLDKPR